MHDAVLEYWRSGSLKIREFVVGHRRVNGSKSVVSLI